MPSPIPPLVPGTGPRAAALSVPVKVFAAATVLLLGSAFALVFWKASGDSRYYSMLDRQLLAAPLPGSVAECAEKSAEKNSEKGMSSDMLPRAEPTSHEKVVAVNAVVSLPVAQTDQGNAKYAQTFPPPNLPLDKARQKLVQPPAQPARQKTPAVVVAFEPIHRIAVPPPMEKRPQIDFAAKPPSISSVEMRDEMLPHFFGVENFQFLDLHASGQPENMLKILR